MDRDRSESSAYYAIVGATCAGPSPAVLIMFVLAVLYYVLPDAKAGVALHHSRLVLATLLWLLATWDSRSTPSISGN